jgi:hypothetical protein
VNLHILNLSALDRAFNQVGKRANEIARLLVVSMALAGFSMQALGAPCGMMPNEQQNSVGTALLTQEVDCHGHANSDSALDTSVDPTQGDCCAGTCQMMSCQVATVMEAASIFSTSPAAIHVLPSGHFDPTSTLVSVLYRPPILS